MPSYPPRTPSDKRQLPLFKDETCLPTGKHHISYSELHDWVDCSYRHKLKHVDQIVMPDEGGSVHTAYGSAIHDAIETFLKTKKMPTGEETIKEFHKNLKELSLSEFTKALKIIEESPEFMTSIPEILEQLPGWMAETFPNWQVVAAEYDLFEPIERQTNISFKGFIDAVIKTPREPTKKLIKEYAALGTVPPQEYDYHVLDWKSCGWGWTVERQREFTTQLQLILYKHFFCKLMGLDLSDAKCGFVLAKRVVPKERKPFDRLQLITVSVGPVAVEKGLASMHSMLGSVRRGFAVKNRRSCEPFCVYRGTKHCT